MPAVAAQMVKRHRQGCAAHPVQWRALEPGVGCCDDGRRGDGGSRRSGGDGHLVQSGGESHYHYRGGGGRPRGRSGGNQHHDGEGCGDKQT